MSETHSSKDAAASSLAEAVEALQGQPGKYLGARVRELAHTVACTCGGVTLRVHYPAFRGAECTAKELVDVLSLFITRFALPRSEVRALHAKQATTDPEDYELQVAQLRDKAIALFKKAHQNTKRNGEAGELLLYLLTEWLLGAPQLIAKMSLKTNPAMPVYGADGVHVRYCSETDRLLLYWGESKLYADVGSAIASAVKSITDSLKPEKIDHEIGLVDRHIEFSGLDPAAQQALLDYLDPFKEESNERVNVITCLIGFDFKTYDAVKNSDPLKAEQTFKHEVETNLAGWSKKLDKALAAAGLSQQKIEIFFFPLPSVSAFRDLFQDKVGWKSSADEEGEA